MGVRESEYLWREQACPLCSDSSVRYLGRRGGSAHRSGLGVSCAIYRCRGCGLIFPNPMPIPTTVQEHYGDPTKYFVEHSLSGKLKASVAILETIEQLGVRRGRILDVGAGRGEMLRAAKESGWTPVGLEPSPDFALRAREFSGAQVLTARLEERPFEPESFDAVTLGAVLEHVFNPRELLEEIHRVVRPGGMLWLDVPNEAGVFYTLGNAYQRLRRRDWVVNLSPTFPPYHVFGFTPASLRKLLQVTGWKLVHFRTFATPSVIEGSQSPVSARLRPLARAVLRLGARLGTGSYMDAWAMRLALALAGLPSCLIG